MKAVLIIMVLMFGMTAMVYAQELDCEKTHHGTVYGYDAASKRGFIKADEGAIVLWFAPFQDVKSDRLRKEIEALGVNNHREYPVSFRCTYTEDPTAVHRWWANKIDYIQDRRVEDILDPAFYLAKYDDLKKVYGSDTEGAKQHWLAYGIKECRQSSATFSLEAYLNRYPDLKTNFGTDCARALDHWLTFGDKEGRSPGIVERPKKIDKRVKGILDSAFYLAKYDDLKKVYGNDTEGATNHWLAYGIQECRQSSPSFSLEAYLNRYPDLKSKFGKDCIAALNHWLTVGRNQGRNAGIDEIMIQGYVKFFNSTRGFGMITIGYGSGQELIMVSIDEVKKAGLETLTEGQEVTFVRGYSARGPEAVMIRVN